MTSDHLFQEELRADPFWMLAACVLVNRTRWSVARGVLDELRRRWPSPRDLSRAAHADVRAVAARLGLVDRRARDLVDLAAAWVARCPRVAADVARLPGCGPYARDSWAIFVDGRRDVAPTDDKLKGYLQRQPSVVVGAIMNGITFESVADGWIFCTADLLAYRWERCRALARTGGHAETLERILARYLEEAAVIRRRARVEEEVSLERLTDAVIQRGHADRYAGPLVGGRFQVMESLSPAGTYYVVDHALADLLVREAGGATPVRRFASRGAAEDYVAGIPPAAVNTEKEAVMAKSVMKKPKAAERKATNVKAKARPEKPTGGGRRTASLAFRELIMDGKLTDDAIFASVQKEFGLDDRKRSYVAWYRNDLRKGGKNPPGPVTNGAAKAVPPKAAGARAVTPRASRAPAAA